MQKWTRHLKAQSNFSGALLIGGAVQRRAMDCIRAGSPDTKTSALVSCLTAPIGIERQIHEKRLVSALRTGLAWANVTIDSNATEYALVIVIIGSRVTELLRVFQLAAN